MVTTFVHSAVSHIQSMGCFLQKACKTEAGVRLEHPSLKTLTSICSRLVPIYVHPSFYRALKLRFSLDVGKLTRDGRVTTELGTGSLQHTIGILTLKDFETIVNIQ